MHPKKEHLTNLKTPHTLAFQFVLADKSIVNTSIDNVRVAGHKYETGKRVSKFYSEHYSALCLMKDSSRFTIEHDENTLKS